MKITIDKFQLAGVGHDAVSGFKIESQRTVQVVRGIRRKAVKPIARGNKETRITFNVHRLWPTLGESELYCLTHGDTLPESGLVTIIAGALNGPQTTRYFRATAIDVTSSQFIGVTTIHSYSIVCGELKTKQKDALDPVP